MNIFIADKDTNNNWLHDGEKKKKKQYRKSKCNNLNCAYIFLFPFVYLDVDIGGHIISHSQKHFTNMFYFKQNNSKSTNTDWDSAGIYKLIIINRKLVWLCRCLRLFIWWKTLLINFKWIIICYRSFCPQKLLRFFAREISNSESHE